MAVLTMEGLNPVSAVELRTVVTDRYRETEIEALVRDTASGEEPSELLLRCLRL
jgi:hypothetical protein